MLINVVTRVVPAAVFATLGVLRFKRVAAGVTPFMGAGSSSEALHLGLVLTSEVLTTAFYFLIAALIARRQAAVGGGRGAGATVLAFAGTWSPLAFAFVAAPPPDATRLLVADALMALGITASCYVALRLGRSFGIRACARQLVTSGPYALVRHPLYVAETVLVMGVALTVLSPLSVAIFALYVLLQVGRAMTEERVLGAAFPEYSAYQARTARFLPGLI